MTTRQDSPVRALEKAILADAPAAVRAICEAHPHIVKSQQGAICLMTAARKGQIETVSFLLDRGADANGTGYYGKHSAHTDLERPLHWAVAFGQLEIVRLLLRRGADVEGGLRYMTPLQTAARVGHHESYNTL